jgi:hypothetical protein
VTSARNTPVATHVLLLRLQVAASALAVGSVTIAGILFLAALFAKQSILARLGLAALSMSLLGHGVTEARGAWTLWSLGVWRGLNGERISRDQQPRRFWVWLTTHVIYMVVSLAAATYLVTISIRPWPP